MVAKYCAIQSKKEKSSIMVNLNKMSQCVIDELVMWIIVWLNKYKVFNIIDVCSDASNARALP